MTLVKAKTEDHICFGRGLAAVDFLMPNYYVWAKIIEALADLGYDPNMLVRAGGLMAKCYSAPRSACSACSLSPAGFQIAIVRMSALMGPCGTGDTAVVS